MYADLVGTTGHRTAAHQRGKLIALFNLKPRLRRFPFLADADNTLAALQNVLQQRRLHHFYMGLPLTAHQRQVVFLHPFLTQLFMQRTQRRTLFRHQQYARGVTVKTVHQLKETRFRAQGTQPFNHAEAQTATAMNSRS